MAKRKNDGSLMGSKDIISNAFIDEIMKINEAGWDIYFIPNPVDPVFTGVKPSDNDIIEHRRFVIDLDPFTATNPNIKVESSVDFFEKAGPTGGRIYCFWVNTGRGFQGHMSIKQNCNYISQRLSRYLNSLAGKPMRFGEVIYTIDSCTSDASRLVRFPYTINHKTGIRGTIGLSQYDKNVGEIDLSSIEPFFGDSTPSLDNDFTNLSQVMPRLTITASRFITEGVSVSRHKAAYAAAANLRSMGVPEETAKAWVLMGAAICKPPLPVGEAIHCVRSAYKK